MKDSGRENEQSGIRDQFARYFRYKWLFIGSAILCILLCYLYLQWKTPEYGVYARIVIKDERKGEPNDFPFRDIDVFEDRNTVDNEIEIITSKSTIEAVVNKLDLTKKYFSRKNDFQFVPIDYSNPVVINVLRGSDELYETPIDIKLIDSTKYELEKSGKTYYYGDPVHLFGADFILSKSPRFNASIFDKIRIKVSTIPETIQDIRGNLSVTQTNRNASMLNLTLLNPVPQQGIDILNAILAEYNQSNLRYRDSQTAITSRIIHDRLNLITDQLSGIENSEQKYKSQMGITELSADAQLYLDKAKESDQHITDARIRMEILGSIEDFARAPSTLSIPPTSGLNDPILTGLVTNLSQLQLEKKELLKTLGPENARVKIKTTQVDDIKSSILSNIETQRRNMQSTLDGLLSQKRRIDGEIRSVPVNERNLTKILRERSIQENIYNYLLQKREEVNIASTGEYSKMRIVDAAYSSPKPVKPKKIIVYFTGLLIALIIPVIFVNARHSTSQKLTESTDILSMGIPVIAEISHGNKPTANNSFLRNGFSFQSEQFRMLIAKLKSEVPGCKTILVTSSEPSEGKSYISTHLAEVFSIWSRKTLLIDADLRKGKISKLLALEPGRVGLSDYLASTAVGIEDIISTRSENNHRVDVIAAGNDPSAVFKLQSSERLAVLFDYVKNNYDQVVINTPPVKLVSDAMFLAPFADATLYIIRQRFTLRRNLKFISSLDKKDVLGKMFIVVNDSEIKVRKNSRFREYFKPNRAEA